MGKLDDLQALVSEHSEQARRGFLSLAELAEDCDALDEAEEQVLRAHKEMSDGAPTAVDFVLERAVNDPKLRQFVVEYLKGDAYWTGTLTGLMADAMSAYAERGLE